MFVYGPGIVSSPLCWFLELNCEMLTFAFCFFTWNYIKEWLFFPSTFAFHLYARGKEDLAASFALEDRRSFPELIRKNYCSCIIQLVWLSCDTSCMVILFFYSLPFSFNVISDIFHAYIYIYYSDQCLNLILRFDQNRMIISINYGFQHQKILGKVTINKHWNNHYGQRTAGNTWNQPN